MSPRSRAAARRWLGLGLGLVAACSSRDIVATGAGSGGSGSGGSGSDGPGAELPSYCQTSGPVILVGDGITVGDSDGNPDSVCTGEVAVLTFSHALCTCEGYATSTMLQTDSFDSAAGPYAPGGTSGDVGINGELRSNAAIDVEGALAVAGTAGIQVQAGLHVAHDLANGGALGSTSATVTSGGDAQLAGNVAVSALTVAGTLTIPPAATLAGTITAGVTTRAQVSIAPPCACDASDLVDIAAFVAGHATDNQNAAIGLTTTQLTGYHGDVTLDLPCGAYYVGPVNGDGALTLRITGHAALMIDGDLALTTPFKVELATDDAELDLMVAGLLSSNQPMVIGDAAHPARTRVYIGGEGTINLSGDSQLATNFYAPRAAVALAGNTTVFGSLFVRRLDQAAPITIHYDIDVRRADVGCPIF